MGEKFLPVGTVCLLKSAQKRVMIIGYLVQSEGKIYDYIGCFFPEGLIFLDKQMMFNHEQIQEVYYMGLSDNEQKRFSSQLKKITTE